jgi:hypothetical protein
LPSGSGRWTLALFAGSKPDDARSNAVWLQTALAQYGDRNLDGALVCKSPCEDLRYDWGLSGVRVVDGTGNGMALVAPDGTVAARWSGFVPPAEVGFAVRWHVGGWRPPSR